ncbi:P-loop containing nucleoside triphosphate hydrolase protein [Lentinula raphanica]|nr:P-loop containing nucleoside triphosphate hydrolase protein [Lentinula raphanica]
MTYCPAPTMKFTGREEVLKNLQEFFGTSSGLSSGALKIFLLQGLGGAGKTQTALEFVNIIFFLKKAIEVLFGNRFSKVYFITASSEVSIQSCYWDIATNNGITNADSWHAGLYWFHIHEENWLIIMDSADDPNIKLSQYLPSCTHGNIIITSRNPELQTLATQSKELENLLPEEGTLLLLKYAFNDQNRITPMETNEAVLIAKELHHFPLALVQAGAYIHQQKCLFEYIGRLQGQRKELLKRDLRQPIDKYESSVYTTWDLSWKKLNPNSRTLLEACAYLHYEGIPRALFQKAVVNIESLNLPLGPSNAVIDAKYLLQNFAESNMTWNDISFDDLVAEAASYSLLQIGDESYRNTYYLIHPLVHQWLRDTTSNNYKQAVQGMIISALQNIYWRELNYDLLETTIISQEASKEHVFFHYLARHCDKSNVLVDGDYYYRLAVGQMWFQLGDYDTTIALWKQLLTVMQEILGPEHISTLRHIQKIALAFHRMPGKLGEALKYLESLLALSKRSIGLEHKDTLITIHFVEVP